MDLTLLSLLLGAIVLSVLYLANLYSYFSKHRIPCPKGTIPLLGHMLPVLTFRKSVVDMCSKMYEEFPNASMIGFYKLTRPVLLLREPQLVGTVLESNFPSFQENAEQPNPIADPLLSKSIIYQCGENWMTGRRHFSNAFNSSRLYILFQSVNGVCQKFVDFLERKLMTSDKYEVELTHLFSKYIIDVALNGGFGIEGHSFEEKDQSRAFHQIYKTLFEPNLWSAVRYLLASDMPNLNNILKVGFIPKKVDTFFRTLVRDLLESRKRESVTSNDFFQLMLEYEKTTGEKLNEELLTVSAFTFFMGATDSSNITLSIVVYHIASNLDIQKKVREEVLSVISKHNGTLTYESLNEMTYLDQVINESQRRYPAVGCLVKLCTQECELSGSDGLRISVKPGTMVHIPIQSLQMDPKYWVDPETFDPERFNEDRKQGIEKFAYLPFGAGPRLCVGMRMASLVMKASIATIMKSYSFELSPKTKLPMKLSPRSFLSSPDGGVWVYIKRI